MGRMRDRDGQVLLRRRDGALDSEESLAAVELRRALGNEVDACGQAKGAGHAPAFEVGVVGAPVCRSGRDAR